MTADSAPETPPPSPERLSSLDAYRGFTMLLMASEAFGLDAIAKQYPESSIWKAIGYNFSHVEWVGGGLWDMIQPSFMFLVGVSMAYSYSNRAARGQTYGSMFLHALWRAFLLTALGVLLRSRWTFEDVLSQIGLGYIFLFLLWNRPWWLVLSAAIAVLGGYWYYFYQYPLPGPDFDLASVGVTPEFASQHNLTGLAAHWNKNTNPAHFADVKFLGLFPRAEPYRFNGGGYLTLSFIPSLGTMLFGLLAGMWLRADRPKAAKFRGLAVAGVVFVATGFALGYFGLCPVVKRIWTPSWAIYSTGWALLALSFFYGVMDVLGWKGWAWPGVVVGMNSIAMYVMAKLLPGWIERTLTGLSGGDWIYHVFDPAAVAEGPSITYAPFVESALVLLVLWFFCYLLYRNRVFIRI